MFTSKGWFWPASFIIIFLLTQDYLFLKWSPGLSLFGLPNWLWWFVAVHFLFIFAFYLFTRNYWKD